MIKRWLAARPTIEVEIYGPSDWDEWGGVLWFTFSW